MERDGEWEMEGKTERAIDAEGENNNEGGISGECRRKTGGEWVTKEKQ